MGFNSGANAMRRSVQMQDALKRKFEKALASDIREFIRKVGDALVDSLIDKQQPVNADDFNARLESIIKQHYKKTSDEFGYFISQHIRRAADDDSTQLAVQATAMADKVSADAVIKRMDNLTKSRIDEFTAATVPARVKDMSRTTNETIKRAMRDAQKQLEGKDFDSSLLVFDMTEFAEQVRKNFIQSSLYRGQLIGQTEIQHAAEQSKYIEGQTFMQTVGQASMFDIEQDDTAIAVAEKMWITMGDDKVRETHAEADMQIVDVGEFFEVGGYQMSVPGDDSQGAPLDEIINCRCQSNIIIN